MSWVMSKQMRLRLANDSQMTDIEYEGHAGQVKWGHVGMTPRSGRLLLISA